MPSHPCEPLSRKEIEHVASILRKNDKLKDHIKIVFIILRELPKEDVYFNRYQREKMPDRYADVTTINSNTGECVEFIVNLTYPLTICQQNIVQETVIPNVQPPVTISELMPTNEKILNDPKFRAKIYEHYGDKINIEDLHMTMFPAGYNGDESEIGSRLMRPIPFFRDPRSNNPYCYPVDGIRTVFDTNKNELVKIDDFGPHPLPPEHFTFFKADDIKAQGLLREDVKPLDVLQPKGPSFQVNGHEIHWQKWSFVVGFNVIEGATLHDIRYADRTVLYRASIADMVVPYGDPSPQHAGKAAFDAGEFGLGLAANTLRLGMDCLGDVHFLDGHLVGSKGEIMTIKDAVCVREEDFGVLWKHYDRHSGKTEVRRSRRLLVEFLCTVGNYDYGFAWIFYQDGNIECKVTLTGFLSLGTWHKLEPPKYGNIVAPNVYGPNHQHFFCARLDFAIDGIKNEVWENNVVHDSENESDGSFQNEFAAQSKLLQSELEAKRNANPETSRTWMIGKRSVENACKSDQDNLEKPSGYCLVPKSVTMNFSHPEAWWIKRAGFTDYHFWVTPFHPEETGPAGKYPNQSFLHKGLKFWTQKDRSIENEDLVVWYTFGVTHIPRPEDYPVMPAEHCGFLLKPCGYFDKNPAYDVPSQKNIH